MTDQTAEQIAEEEKAFESGYAVASDEDAPVEKAVEPEVAKEPEQPAGMFGMDEAQIKNLLAKATEVDSLKNELARTRDKLAGRMGEVVQKLNALTQTPEEEPARPGTRKLAVKLERLKQEYPDLAEMLEQDLAGVELGSEPEVSAESVGKVIDEAFSERDHQRELAELQRRHSDWATIRNTPDFRIWDAALPPQKRAKLWSDNAADVSDMLTEFKEQLAQQRTPKPKTDRLARAVTPKGVPAATGETDEEAFLAGFQRAQQGR